MLPEPRPEYAERLKQEKIKDEFLADLQAVLDRHGADMQIDWTGHVEFAIYCGKEEPIAVFSEPIRSGRGNYVAKWCKQMR